MEEKQQEKIQETQEQKKARKFIREGWNIIPEEYLDFWNNSWEEFCNQEKEQNSERVARGESEIKSRSFCLCTGFNCAYYEDNRGEKKRVKTKKIGERVHWRPDWQGKPCPICKTGKLGHATMGL